MKADEAISKMHQVWMKELEEMRKEIKKSASEGKGSRLFILAPDERVRVYLKILTKEGYMVHVENIEGKMSDSPEIIKEVAFEVTWAE